MIPDATTRIMLLDFDTLPPKAEDADAVVRFRLKKSLPFEVEQAAVSFDRQGTADPVRLMAAVTPRNMLEEYESLVREAGYNPGAVVPSMIAHSRRRGWSASDHGHQGGTGNNHLRHCGQ